jgi:hypothetical protein
MPRRRNRKVKLNRSVMLGSRPDDKVKCCTNVSTSHFCCILLLFLFLHAQDFEVRFHPLLTFYVQKEHAYLAATFCVSVRINFYIDGISCYISYEGL